MKFIIVSIFFFLFMFLYWFFRLELYKKINVLNVLVEYLNSKDVQMSEIFGIVLVSLLLSLVIYFYMVLPDIIQK